MDGTRWTYVLLVLVTLPPMVPNSAILTGAGALAVTGALSLPVLLLVVFSSMVVGDLAVFCAGRGARGRSLRWLARSARRRAVVERLVDAAPRYGPPFAVAVRFVPGGRGLGAFVMGTIGSLRSYVLGAAVAEALFASYTLGFGYLGGRFLTGVAPFLLGPAASLLVAGVVTAARRVGRGAAGRGPPEAPGGGQEGPSHRGVGGEAAASRAVVRRGGVRPRPGRRGAGPWCAAARPGP